MQVKLTIERIEQSEKQLCEEQVKKNNEYNELFQLLGEARRGLLQQDDVNRFAPSVDTMGEKQPIAYTLEEGGLWVNVSKNNPKPPSYAFAIKYSDGEIWDINNATGTLGLRPTARSTAAQEPQKETSEDVRVVPRKLLEDCLDILNYKRTGLEVKCDVRQRLKATLAIEKSELKTPPVPADGEHAWNCWKLMTGGRGGCDCGAAVAP